jgi:hypothetical protein
MATIMPITNAITFRLLLVLLENVCCPHGCEYKLLRHLPGELIDGLPAGAVHRHDEIWVYLLHLLNRRGNNRLKNRSREVKSAQYCMDLARLCNRLAMFDRIDDAGMGTSTDDHQSLAFHLDRYPLVIMKGVYNPFIVNFRFSPGKTFFKIRYPLHFT